MYCSVKEIIREVLDTDVPDSECVFAVVLTRGDVRHMAQDWNLADDELETVMQRLDDAFESHKQEWNGKKKRKKKNSNRHGNHRKITSEKNIPDTSQTGRGRGTGDASAWPASLPAGVSLPGVFARADRRPPPPAPVSPVSAALKDVLTAQENSLLIHHKIADFINNLRGGERFLPHLTTPRINHGLVITQNFAGFCADIHDMFSPSSACNTTSIASRSSLTNASPSPPFSLPMAYRRFISLPASAITFSSITAGTVT